MKETNDEKNLTVVDHLAEFRKHLIWSIAVFLIVTLLSFQFADKLVLDLVSKAKNTQFVYLSPAELFTSYIRIAMAAGLLISLPFFLYRLWVFVKPGLLPAEKGAIRNALLLGFGLFIGGMVFAYEVVLPISLEFFAGFQMPEVRSSVGFANYFSYATSVVLAFGLVFELPILVVLLVRLGVVNTTFLAKNRKYVLLAVFVVAAVLTPPDVVSQILLGIPMMLLFELGIVMGRAVEKQRALRALDDEQGENEA